MQPAKRGATELILGFPSRPGLSEVRPTCLAQKRDIIGISPDLPISTQSGNIVDTRRHANLAGFPHDKDSWTFADISTTRVGVLFTGFAPEGSSSILSRHQADL